MTIARDALPTSFAAFRDRHRGATVVVCGCGASLGDWPGARALPPGLITIGVNDVGRRFTPDYLVVVNHRRQFTPERHAHVVDSWARAVFTQLPDLDLPHARVVRFELGRRGGTGLDDPRRLDYTDNSPYVAVCLAMHLGAARIGLIGVDFSDHHFFAATGRHRLNGRLAGIDAEYAALAAACSARGVALVNLSATSRLTTLPRVDMGAWLGGLRPLPAPRRDGRRVFFVHYRFLSCGTVFETGLREAADSLGVVAEHGYWDEPGLAARIERFRPELILVVHGRRFAQRFGGRAWRARTAVWLLDEPYEVDDTAVWSQRFHTVFVNDAASLQRHRHAHLLPAAYAPGLHRPPDGAGPRRYRLGFIGGGNPSRQRMLAALAQAGLLDYVVGGPWHDPRLRALCISDKLPADEATALYRQSDIVVNVFRDRHHYNRQGLPGTAMNPRVCEALACGALVISEPREALCADVPELPVFRTADEAVALATHFIARPEERARVQAACAARLAGATYARRLEVVMDISLGSNAVAEVAQGEEHEPPAESTPAPSFDDDWLGLGGAVHPVRDGAGADAPQILVDPGTARGPALERGLASRRRFDAVDLSFEVRLSPGACLLAKVHQGDQVDQASNSYHLLMDQRRAYLARHQHVFRQFDPPQQEWTALRLVCVDGVLSLYRAGRLLHRVRDGRLTGGFAFVGAQGGPVWLRRVVLAPATGAVLAAVARETPDPRESPSQVAAGDRLRVLRPVRCGPPRWTIVTTVYDRVECLRQCIASVQRLGFGDFEHLIVADHPDPEVMERISVLVDAAADPRIGLYELPERHNDWGIAPAAAGLRLARGEYLSFLSDDNGYTPDHPDPLMRTLDADPRLGFVYSSCRYDGRLVLNHPVPRPGRIDLGQPMFRRELFEIHLGDDLPFDMMAWDWHLVDTLMRRGVRWRHVDRQSFIFRLAKYPQLMASRQAA
ncbi:glycosyltransferase [Xylophilus sp. GOD-11R]|uniref:glycosyltransferase family protein n=1 Tax=Xylophilus sp. GOD-11R TaxID=3089814 RepID=UPI00298C0DB4|nr:glycosyltransferase [Xylophilus sp. GOD-11R]WPB55017.1 glycosyltransferase [Xylophilus sp. GOD-11R]